MARRFLAVLLLASVALAAPAFAQDDLEGVVPTPAENAAQEPLQATNPESIQIGLSTNRVAITADFSGADLTIFGSLDYADPLVARQGRYDVIVVLEGPAQEVVVRRKERVLGMWINMESETFTNVPVSYSVATTRMPQDITDTNSYKRLSLGADYLHIEPVDRDGNPVTIAQFRDALRERKAAAGLFSIRVGGVEFLSQSLFRASLPLSPSVPGRHAQGARVPVQERRVHQGKLGAAFDRQVGFRADHRPLRDQPRFCLRHPRDGSRDRHRLARPHRVPEGLSLRHARDEGKRVNPASASRLKSRTPCWRRSCRRSARLPGTARHRRGRAR